MVADGVERLNQEDAHSKFLDDEFILNTFMRFQSKQVQLRRLFDALGDLQNAVDLAKQALPVICHDQIPVFLSYKFGNDEQIEEIVSALQELTENKLKIHYAGEFNVGTEYRQKILEAIRESYLFVLLLPPVSDNLDWCLYETGMFRMVMEGDPLRKLICIHHGQKPKPIQNFTMIEADRVGITKLLEDICFGEGYFPGMPILNDGKLNRRKINNVVLQMAKVMEGTMNVGKTQIYKARFLRLLLAGGRSMLKYEDLSKEELKGFSEKYERIRSAHDEEMENRIEEILELRNIEELSKSKVIDTDAHDTLFGLNQMPDTLHGLLDAVWDGEESQPWMYELCHAIRDVSRNRRPIALQNCVRAATGSNIDSGKMFRPVLTKVEQVDANDAKMITLCLVEDVTAMDASLVPKKVMAVARALRLGYRFRWEVLEKYTREDLDDDEYGALKNTLDGMMREAEAFDLDDPELLMNQFSNPVAKHIMSIYADWWKLRNPEETGELDLAMQKNDIPEIRRLLTEFMPKNHAFMELITARFAEDNVVATEEGV